MQMGVPLFVKRLPPEGMALEPIDGVIPLRPGHHTPGSRLP